MRLRGPWRINQSRLDTSVSSQGGAIGADLGVVVSLSAYSFFPDMEAWLTNLWELSPMFAIVPLADADSPQFILLNRDPSPRLYDVQWRHVNP